jgi:hypothetical protein
MRHKTADATRPGRRGPEEIVLDGWLEESGPYVSLRDTKGFRFRESTLGARPGSRPVRPEAPRTEARGLA